MIKKLGGTSLGQGRPEKAQEVQALGQLVLAQKHGAEAV